MTTISTVSPLDADFIADRITECIAFCRAQASRSFENEYRFNEMHRLGVFWIVQYNRCSDSSPRKRDYFVSLLDDLYQQYLNHQVVLEIEEEYLEEVMDHNEKVKPVLKTAPSAQLPVLRVLGQVTKTQVTLGASPLSIDWRPTDPMPRTLFSITRPVGGLVQCQ